MATVIFGQQRYQNSHFGLYRTSVGGDELVSVRRKVGEPTDYQHSSSRRLKQQRDRLGLASHDWDKLTPTQKALWRRTLGFGYRSGSLTQETLLAGRQLFISQDLYSLLSQGTQLVAPYEFCIILCDELHAPLTGQLYLYYYEPPHQGEPPPGHNKVIFEPWDNGKPAELYGWHLCERIEIQPGHWLFPGVPRGKQYYRVEGTSAGYYDPKLPETQFMTEKYIKTYHYHVLLFGLELVILEPWTLEQPEFPYTLLILEKWHEGQLGYECIILEEWHEGELPEQIYQLLIDEPWDEGEFEPPIYELIIEEEWHEGELPPVYYTLLIEEEWHEAEFPPTIPPPTHWPEHEVIQEKWTS